MYIYIHHIYTYSGFYYRAQQNWLNMETKLEAADQAENFKQEGSSRKDQAGGIKQVGSSTF